MAYSLPSIAVSAATLHKLPQVTSSSITLEKSLHYPRSSQPTPNGISEASLQPLDARGALALLGDGDRVDSAYYVPLLQHCIDARSLPEAEMIHAHIFKTGFHEEVFLSTSLVNVYMKCGAAGHALKLFDKLQKRNVVTWTSMITGYVQNSQPENAIEVFLQLLVSGCYPTNYTLGAVLSACCAIYLVKLGEQIHGYMIKYGIGSDTSLGNSLCSLYSKCGRMESSVKAFHRIPQKNVISWTTIITACGDNGDAESGLSLFVEMLLEDAKPNDFTLTSVLSLCSIAQDFELGKQIHSFCIKSGCEENLPVKNSIMYLYLKHGEIEEANRLFNEMETVSLITWNAMIAGHAQMMNSAKDDLAVYRSGMEALQIFQKLNRSGMKPDLFSFSSILSVCSGLVALYQGEQVHAQTIKSGYLSDVVVSSSLVNMYNKCGCIENATKAFVEMPTRTLIAWTSMLTGYSQHGRSREAIDLFENMRFVGVRPNQVTFVGVLSACSHAGMVEEAKYYFNMMKDEYRIKPVLDHYACMVDMYVRMGQLEDAFSYVKEMDVEPNEVIWSILIAGCRSHGNMELGFYAAEKLLDLKPKSIETYILLLNMYILAGKWQDVARVRKLMKDENIGSIKDRSWISVKDKLYIFKADDKSHSQSAEIYDFLENLLQNATCMGYVPYKNVDFSDEEDKEQQNCSATHHSERIAIAFGLMNTAGSLPIRVVKNIAMCRDCHSSVKYFTIVTKREIVVRDSKRLHKFRDGKCSCGDFGALL